MKHYGLLILCLLTAHFGLAQSILSRADFISGAGDAASWGFNRAGDQKVILLQEPGQPVAVLSPAPGSWGFWQRNLEWKGSLPRRIRASAWIFSNVPEKTAIVISDGAAWGGACPRVAIAGGTPGTAGSWQCITVEQEIQVGGIVSVAVGYDYQAAGAWCLIAGVVVEEVGPGIAVAAATPPSFPGAMPAAFAAVLNGSEFFRMAVVPELTPYRADTPVDSAAPERVTMLAPINGHIGSLALLRNSSDEVQSFQIRFSGDAALQDRISLYRYRYEDGNPDRPLPLDADGLVEIGREQTIGVELQLDTHDLPAGEYRGTLTVTPQNVIVPVCQVAYEFTVAPVLLPERVEDAMIFNWDYAAARNPESLDFLLDGRVNTFSVAPVDLACLEEIVCHLRARGFEPGDYTLFLEDWHLREKNRFDEADKAWLNGIVAKTEALGLDYSDWYLHIYDEVFSDDFFAVATAIKQHNPSIRIFSDHFADVDTLRRFAPVIDAWSPLEGTLPPFSSRPEAWDYMRSSGKPVYVYSCDSVAGLAAGNYRLMPYLAYLEQLDGFSYWSVLSTPDRGSPGIERWGMTYTDAAGRKQPSRRWWQWRAGIEDYLLLRMMEERFGRARAEAVASGVRDAWNTPGFAGAVALARAEMLQQLGSNE